MTKQTRFTPFRLWMLVITIILGGCLTITLAQETRVTCPTGQVPTPTVVGAVVTVVCTTTTPPPVQAPVIVSFTANPASIPTGSSSVLQGALSGGAPTTLTIDQGIGNVMGQTSVTVKPTVTTTYRLTAANSAGSVSATATVTVTTTPPPTNTAVLTNAAAHPSTVTAGATTSIDWTSTGGNPLTITIERPDGSTVTPGPAVTVRSFTVTAQSTVGAGLWRVVYNKGRPACTATVTTNCESWRHVTITTTTSGGGGGTNPPEPPTGQIVGLPVTAAELGECSATLHDRWTEKWTDGRIYRIWHPQVESTGCVYGHEHGDDPAIQTTAWVRDNFNQEPHLMGFGAVRMGMDEPHNGYKVHVAVIGEMNDEGRINLNATTSMPHVGTGGQARFSVNHHSAQIVDWHQNGIHHTVVVTRFDTGVTGNAVCETRVNAPTKDGTILNSVSGCKVNSPYEIWGMVAYITRANGSPLLTKIITPAIFDPITLFNRTNPGELIYAWDPRVAAYKNFPEQNWSGSRGCDRENYSQVGYHFSENDQSEEYLLDVRTNMVVATANAWTTRLVVGHSNTAGNPPYSSDILQFKKRRAHCDQRGKLSLTN